MKKIDNDSYFLTKEEVIERRIEDNQYIFCAICPRHDEDSEYWYYNEDLDNGRGDYICGHCITSIFNGMKEFVKQDGLK